MSKQNLEIIKESLERVSKDNYHESSIRNKSKHNIESVKASKSKHHLRQNTI